MLKPINSETVYKFVGKNINKDTDLPVEGIGTGSEAYDATAGKTYIFVDGSWEDKA